MKKFRKKRKTNSSNTNRKKCPSCGRKVKANAVNCKFCGYSFSSQSIPKTSTNNSKKQSIKSVNKPVVNNYSTKFRLQKEISGGHPSENDSLHSLVNKLSIVASDVNMIYKDGSAYMVQLVDNNGNPFAKANEAINITIDGRTYARLTNESGVAKITINLRAGSYQGTAQYGNTIIENVVTVNNKLSIVADYLNMNYRDGSAFEVQLVDENGNSYALANEPVKITVAGKTYTRLTDENGVARIVINLGAGTYPVTTEYNNKTLSNTITINKT